MEKRLGIAAVALLFALPLGAQQENFSDVRVRFVKSKAHEMDESNATLTLDSAGRRLRVKSNDVPLDLSYDDVLQVVVEVDTLGQKSGFGASFAGFFAGGLVFGTAVATAIDKPFDNEHFVLVEYKTPGGASASCLLDVGKRAVAPALKALKAAFGERLILPVFEEKSEALSVQQLASSKTRYRSSMTDAQHPLPELRPDKALIVVAAPATVFRRGGLIATLHADDVLVGVTRPGAYAFFYLDAGERFLVSRTSDVVGLRMKLEAGKGYYLTQTFYTHGARSVPRSFLTRHSRELVTYLIGGSAWSEWKVEAEPTPL